MSSILGRNVLDLNDPSDCQQICQYIGQTVGEAVESMLGMFTLHTTVTPELELLAMTNWRTVKISTSSLDKLPLAIAEVKKDIVAQKAKNFMKWGPPFVNPNVAYTVANGRSTSFRITINHNPFVSEVCIDWMAWP
ncbi:MAG: hypothetical protein JW395_1067 [Nitrospira sp.]|nr:hypothetical protein [Nitrospira sp.]